MVTRKGQRKTVEQGQERVLSPALSDQSFCSIWVAGDDVLEGMITQMLKTTAQASAAIDEALAFVESSNKRIALLEAQRNEHDRNSPLCASQS